MLSKQQILPDISIISQKESDYLFVITLSFSHPFNNNTTDIYKFRDLKKFQTIFIDSETETIVTKERYGFSLLSILTLTKGDL